MRLSNLSPIKVFFSNIAFVNKLVYGSQYVGGECCYDLAIVLGGSNYRIMKGRAEKAFDLYKSGTVKKILLSGGKGFLSLHRKESEATVMKRWLLQWGVPEEDILLEGNSRSTKENLDFVLKKTKEVGGKQLLITSAFHVRRAYGLFAKALERTDVKAYAYGVCDDPPRKLVRIEGFLLVLYARRGLIEDEEF